MKKIWFSLIFVTFCVFATSCNFFNDIYYISVKNNTNKKITVTIEEDPEVFSAKQWGPQKEVFDLQANKIRRTNIVSNSYFKIIADNELVTYVNNDFDNYVKGDYNLIGENALLIINKTDIGYTYDYVINE